MTHTRFTSERTALTVIATVLCLTFASVAQSQISPTKLAKKRAKALAKGTIYGPEGRQRCDATTGECENRYLFGHASESYGCTTGPTSVAIVDDPYSLDRKTELYEEGLDLAGKALETVLEAPAYSEDPWAAIEAQSKANDYLDAAEKKVDEADDYYVPSYALYTTPTSTCKTRRWDVEFVHRNGQTTLRVQQDLASPSKVLKSSEPCSLTITFSDRTGGDPHSSTLSCTADSEARVWEARVSDGFLEAVDLDDRTVTLEIDSGGRRELLTAKRFGSRYRYTLADFVLSNP